jgi:hypothetical protein
MKKKGIIFNSSKTMKGLLIVFLIVVLFTSVFYGLKQFNQEGYEDTYDNSFILVHMTNCGHCQTLLPIWEDAEQSNTTQITMRSVEMSEPEGSKLCEEHNITGFPTMILFKNNTSTNYSGERTKEGLLAFLEENN